MEFAGATVRAFQLQYFEVSITFLVLSFHVAGTYLVGVVVNEITVPCVHTCKDFTFVEYLHTNNIKCFENVWLSVRDES